MSKSHPRINGGKVEQVGRVRPALPVRHAQREQAVKRPLADIAKVPHQSGFADVLRFHGASARNNLRSLGRN
jgi:hypothetical protein